MEAIKKNPEKYYKTVFPPHLMSTEGGKMNGVAVLETDDEEKIIDSLMSDWPEASAKIVPLFDAAKVAELYLKIKK